MKLIEVLKLVIKLIMGKKETKKEISPVSFKNNSPRLENEYYTLKEQNLDLYLIIEHLNKRFSEDFNKKLVITMIYRSQEEQDEIYIKSERNGVSYIEKPWKSPHQFYHAVDIRSRDLSEEQIKLAVDSLNATYNPDNYYRFTALCHDIGLGDHFHIQFVKGK